MNKPELVDFNQERIRTLHYTWIAFFITFYLWFNMAPLASTMLRELNWLTKDHIKVLAICNVALTIPGRIIIGILIDRYGPRRVFGWLMIVMSFPVFAFALGNTFIQLLVSRLLLSVIGAGFVVGIRMVANWFPPKMIGRAEGFYAGWGNFGSAWAAMTLPWIALNLFSAYEDGWRYALLINGLISLVYGVIYLRIVTDMPDGEVFHGAKKVQPMEVSSWFDLFQFLVWSAPLMGALGLLTWRLSNITLGDATEPFFTPTMLHISWAVLGAIYLMHCIKTLQVNVPLLKAGVPEEEKYSFANVAVLNTTYFANFGAELAVVSMLPLFFENVFTISPTAAGMVAASFAFVNLFARPVGGLVSDALGSRKLVMLIYMLGIAAGFFGMAFITAAWPIWLAVVLTITCSIFVQGAEGATFAVIPFIKRRMTGQIAGMAGAYGNVGAVCYLVIYSLPWVDAKTFFLILAGGAAVSFLCCLFFMTEPEGSFADEFDEDHMKEDTEGHLIKEDTNA